MRGLVGVLALGVLLTAQPAPSVDPTPQSIEEFRAAVVSILNETGVPGAGISLVRADGVEWEGGVGLADRDRAVPVTADTHFRVGSISKTFVAIAIVQMYYDDLLALDATVESIAPEVVIDNPWHDTDPVRVIHLLQHTAGFDDMHFNELYNVADPPAISMRAVLQRNPHSRRVRWRPGTRMSYSNPGYGVAGYLIEKVTGEAFEDYISRKILSPLAMNTSSFRLEPEDERLFAQGYRGDQGPPTGFPQIYHRPAGNLHSSAHEMGRFVRMLLNWGELDEAFVIDPEYLGNMERASTTLAAAAGLRNTYGSGISWDLTLPFPVLGHGGGIEGFTSTYGYSPARDVGYVVLLNSASGSAGTAIRRLASLAIRYLKRDVEPVSAPEFNVDAATLAAYEGYYEDANPRNAIAWSVQRLLSGRFIYREGGRLYMKDRLGEPVLLLPVSERTFRRERDTDATIVFVTDAEGKMVLTGSQYYAERTPAWRAELLTAAIFAAVAVVISPLLMAIVWVARIGRARPHGFWSLKGALLLGPLVIVAPGAALATMPMRNWGTQNWATWTALVATLALPALAVGVVLLAAAAYRRRASTLLLIYACGVAIALIVLSVYLWAHGLIGLRLWAY